MTVWLNDVDVVVADLGHPEHGQAVVALLNAYAQDEMGGGQPLPAHVQENLVAELRRRPQAHVLLAWSGEDAVGMAICMEGFSTFACQPLMNLHDLVVLPAHRGRGISGRLLQAVEALALERGCCKLTLEVLSGNLSAQAAYRKAGFAAYVLDPSKGTAQFWQKRLPQA